MTTIIFNYNIVETWCECPVYALTEESERARRLSFFVFFFFLSETKRVSTINYYHTRVVLAAAFIFRFVLFRRFSIRPYRAVVISPHEYYPVVYRLLLFKLLIGLNNDKNVRHKESRTPAKPFENTPEYSQETFRNKDSFSRRLADFRPLVFIRLAVVSLVMS